VRLIFFFIVQLTGIISSGQKDLALGDVITDTAFNCSDSLHRKFSERLFSIPDICDSKNEIEIRLIGSSIRLAEIIIFSYKDGKWDAKKYINSAGKLGWKQTIISVDFSIHDGTYPEYHPCRHILNHLIDNKIFLVTDQSKSIPGEYLGHGRFLTLSYKTKNLFRSYSFQYPDSYLQTHPDSKEYVYLKEIVKTLRELFE
jgi:hypothetical protein